jgi:hypothetical protein
VMKCSNHGIAQTTQKKPYARLAHPVSTGSAPRRVRTRCRPGP